MVWAALKEASQQRRCRGASHRSAAAALTPCLGSSRVWAEQRDLKKSGCSGPCSLMRDLPGSLISLRGGSQDAQDSPSLSSCVLSWLKTWFARKPPQTEQR